MAAIHLLLEEYAESHRNGTNKLIHWICVPAIMISLVGLVWSIPVPEFLQNLPFLVNWGILFVLLCMVYYFALSPSLALGMVVVTSFFLWVVYQLDQVQRLPLWALCLLIFVLAWVGQSIGHKIEGKKPSFLKDLQFLLIGPVWLLSFIYQKIGIRY
ncbi:DUF962 domain-containing protein [Rufibacter glacialis]|uniref:DUF962 domain-containing protein n=1 Tax=Rufibacter glacialis TaxID=1259555 RepID=A0A5M8QEH7_9BACT|nr:Mpo1-like protein [Rufibacter glacialis]KAA6434445.1 DUF962 domain-containing protein [Rufibacter glacialis]GGK69684.1 hypothetical protein GCM10011405_17180 [Rufibacter glacialis]